MNEKQVTILPQHQLMLNQALALHQAGKLDDAESLYQQLRLSWPSHPVLLTNLGTIALQRGRYHEAVEMIGQSLAIELNQPSALNNLGNALKQLNRLDEALASYDKAIAISPSFADAYLNRGDVLEQLKRFDEALASYDKAIAINPHSAESYSNRGNALKELNRLAESVASYDRAIAINPNYALAHSNRGVALQSLKQFDESLLSCERAIVLDPNYAEAYLNRGNALKELNRLDESVASYDRAIAINPNYALAHSNRGAALQSLKQFDESLLSCERAIVLDPNYAEAYLNRGNVLKDLQCLDEALTSYDKAMAINPNYAHAYSNRGVVLQDLKRIDESITSYDKAIAINPNYAEAYFNKSIVKILNGDYLEGWQLYEWRWLQEPLIHAVRHYIQPLWLGEQSIAGKTLLIYPEQGLGDYIQFIRYAELVEQLGARVVLELPLALMTIASSLKHQYMLIETGKALPDFDYHCPIMSLPLAFKTTLDTIPSKIPYLYADTEKSKPCRQRLGEKTLMRIGLVWSGSSVHKNDSNRSISFKALNPLFDLPVEFHCLQKEIRADDEQAIAANGKMVIHKNFLNDFSDTAALIEEMDLVISVDTSVAHLAGALGKAVWILLPYAPDYRWMLDREDSPWYPTAKLFRQSEIGDWEGVIDDVNNCLRVLIDYSENDDSLKSNTLVIKPNDYSDSCCPICGGRAVLYDVVDFNKCCEEPRGKFLPLAGEPIDYIQCEGCQFTFAPAMYQWSKSMFAEKIYNQRYVEIDPDYLNKRPMANSYLIDKIFGHSKNQIRHLDYGGGSGLLSQILSSKDWNSNSYDLFYDENNSIDSLGKFNLITAFEVFEHVSDVNELLNNVSNLMDDSCLVLFSTLLSDGNIKKNERLHWWYASPRNGHISLFSSQSLKILGERSNLNFLSFGANYHCYFNQLPSWANIN